MGSGCLPGEQGPARWAVCAAELQQGKTESDLGMSPRSLSFGEELSMVSEHGVCLQPDWVSPELPLVER